MHSFKILFLERACVGGRTTATSMTCKWTRVLEVLELTIRSHHGKSAFHVNAKIQIPEQRGTPGVAEVHIHEPQDGRGYRLSRRESEDVFWILLNEL